MLATLPMSPSGFWMIIAVIGLLVSFAGVQLARRSKCVDHSGDEDSLESGDEEQDDEFDTFEYRVSDSHLGSSSDSS